MLYINRNIELFLFHNSIVILQRRLIFASFFILFEIRIISLILPLSLPFSLPLCHRGITPTLPLVPWGRGFRGEMVRSGSDFITRGSIERINKTTLQVNKNFEKNAYHFLYLRIFKWNYFKFFILVWCGSFLFFYYSERFLWNLYC